ncbi:hypothetical protein MTR67_013757 [Solanum verrucosum]|uniref:RAB6-interacting golgin n=1 Tax=Solanum verrucosum TaxID=315347 RepID=A0AAF0QCH8_SOLVR|nr:hypothetical protein MTR67_013757 [Solanum verrucosum]
MATDASSDRNATAKPVLLPEIGSDGIARESPVIAYTEKIIEAEQLQLRKYIDENYSKIRDVEKELANLSMEMKLTAGPKKAALEHMRKKIEMSAEKIRIAKEKEEQARKATLYPVLSCLIDDLEKVLSSSQFPTFQLTAWEAALKAVKDEEDFKQKLCEDLNNLVRESSNTQLARLEELKRKLEALNPSRASTSSALDLNSVGPAPSSMNRDVPSVQGSQESLNGSSETTLKEGNTGNAAAENGQNQQREARGKKKINAQGREKGIGIIPKSRGAAPPGWTGSGFDVDGRS